MDDGVASVWRVVLNGRAEWLARKILDFEMTPESVAAVLRREATDLQEKAFQTILRNRVQRGGILAAGAGLVKTGENGRGLKSRWYPVTLARRIREINREKDHLTFVQGDGFALIEEHKADAEAAFYIDPPYTLAARRLYTVWHINHGRLFAAMAECKGDFLMSYDNTAEIAQLARRHGFQSRAVGNPGTRTGRLDYSLVGRDLGAWLQKRG
jgi:DNA adenine methylase